MRNHTINGGPFKVLQRSCFGLCGVIFLVGAVFAQTPAEQIADRVLTALKAASEARSENTREAQTWKEERERLNVLQQTIQQRIDQQRVQSKSLRSEISKLKAQNEALEPQRLTIKNLEALADTQASVINQSLDALALNMPPGVVPKYRALNVEAIEKLQDALNRLEATENNLQNVAVELSTGERNGKALAVEVLRVGGAATWWRALDGQTAGHAYIKEGKLILELVTDSDDRQAILKACDIAKGRAAPQIVSLPFSSSKGGRK